MSVARLCGWCSAPVVDKRTRKGMPMLYCTDRCRWTASNARVRERKMASCPAPRTRSCSECGAVFVVQRTSPRALTCGKACQIERKKRRDRAWEHDHREHVREQERLRARRRADLKPAAVKPPKRTAPRYDAAPCAVCGTMYLPVRARQKVCGVSCADERRRLQRVEWWSTHGDTAIARYRTPEHRALRAQRALERSMGLPRPVSAVAMGHCLWCGDDAAVTPDDPYCSDECRWEDASDRQRESA